MANPGLMTLVEEAERLIGGLRSAGVTPSGFTAVRPRDMDPILQLLERVADAVPRFLPAEETVLSARAVAVVDAAMQSSGGGYELVRNRLRLAKGRLLAHARRWQEADDAFGDLAFQPHTACDDVGSVREAMLLDRSVRPNLVGASPALAVLLLERLLFLLSRHPGVAQQLDLVDAFGQPLADLLKLPGVPLVVAARTGLSANLLEGFGASMSYMRVSRTFPHRSLRPGHAVFKVRHGAGFRRLLLELRRIAASRGSFDLSRASLHRAGRHAPTRRFLVTRGMGGAGDVTTMIPGAVALARKHGVPVHFAVPRSLMPLMDRIPELVPLAATDEITFGDYETWFNLSECPGSRAESATAPFVKQPRIEIFAAALGITPVELDRHGWTAPFRLDAAQEATRRSPRGNVRRRGRKLIGVAPFSREEYKSTPALLPALERLKDQYDIVVLHTVQLPALDAAGVQVAHTPELGSLVATVAACDYVITIDTVHLHLAGALGVPTVAIFGPTDGRLATRAYAKTVLLQPWRSCGIMPCWRHEDSPCQVSLGPVSACLRYLGPEEILAAFGELVRAYPAEPEAGQTLTAA